jgi:hypothetical protein
MHSIKPPTPLKPLVCHIAFMVNLWTLLGSNFFIVPMVGKRQIPMMLCKMPLRLLKRMHDITFHVNRPTFFHCPLFGIYIDEPTLWFRWMASKHWLTSSSLTPFEQIWFHGHVMRSLL